MPSKTMQLSLPQLNHKSFTTATCTSVNITYRTSLCHSDNTTASQHQHYRCGLLGFHVSTQTAASCATTQFQSLCDGHEVPDVQVSISLTALMDQWADGGSQMQLFRHLCDYGASLAKLDYFESHHTMLVVQFPKQNLKVQPTVQFSLKLCKKKYAKRIKQSIVNYEVFHKVIVKITSTERNSSFVGLVVQ